MHGFAAESGGVDVFEHLGGPELQYDVQAVDTRSRATEGAMIGHRGKPHKNSAQGLYDLQIRSKLPTYGAGDTCAFKTRSGNRLRKTYSPIAR